MRSARTVSFGFALGTLVGSLGVVGLPTATRAATADYTFIACGFACTGPLGSVHVEEIVNGLDFTVSLASGNLFVNTGQDASFAFSLVGNPTLAFSGITSGFTQNSNSATVPPPPNNVIKMDGAGNYEYGVTWGGGTGGSAPGPGLLEFVISAAGLTLASLEVGTNGFLLAADIIQNCVGTTCAGATGVIWTGSRPDNNNPPPPEVPLPGAVWLLGTVLAGSFGISKWRRRREQKVAA